MDRKAGRPQAGQVERPRFPRGDEQRGNADRARKPQKLQRAGIMTQQYGTYGAGRPCQANQERTQRSDVQAQDRLRGTPNASRRYAVCMKAW